MCSELEELAQVAYIGQVDLAEYAAEIVRLLRDQLPVDQWPAAIRNEIAVARQSMLLASPLNVEGRSAEEIRTMYKERALIQKSPCDSGDRSESNGKWRAPGNANTKRGDFFFSYADHFHFMHGHVGLFITDPKDPKTDQDAANTLTVVEAPGRGKQVWAKKGADRKEDELLCNPEVYRPKRATQEDIDFAVWYAQQFKGAEYNNNFAFTRFEPLTFHSRVNCSQLVWHAYRHGPSRIDLARRLEWAGEADILLKPGVKAVGVYPIDMKFSPESQRILGKDGR